jgi:diaminopimelate epimerase
MLRLSKLHGLGNDFLVALDTTQPGDGPLVPDAETARRLCDRHEGVGADGLLYGLGVLDGPGELRMVLLNADGSEAEISGNGIRCLVQEHLRAAGRAEGAVDVQTAAGLRRVRTVRGDTNGELWSEVDFGAPRPGPELSGAAASTPARSRATVDLGNPHLVLLVDDPGDLDAAEVGPGLEASFADGINVHVVHVVDRTNVGLQVWERGVGITQACGSGAVATATAVHDWGLTDDRVTVHMPGGTAEVLLAGGTAVLCGPSTFVAEVTVP